MQKCSSDCCCACVLLELLTFSPEGRLLHKGALSAELVVLFKSCTGKQGWIASLGRVPCLDLDTEGVAVAICTQRVSHS